MSNFKYREEELLKILSDFNEKYGFPQSDRKFTVKNNLPSKEMYERRFGSWRNALFLAGIEIPKNKKKTFGSKNNNYSLDEIINELKILVKLHLENNVKLPSINTLIENSKFLSGVLLYKTFKSIEILYEKIGYDDYKSFNCERTRNDMINKFLEIKNINGRTPNSRDIDSFCKNNEYYYNNSTYIRYFGSLRKFYELIQDTSNLNTTRMMSNNEIINNLHKLKSELNFIPTKVEINNCSYLPYVPSILNRLKYSSLVDLQRDLFGETSENIIRLTTDKGTKCLSTIEYITAIVLEKHNYHFIKDGYYKDFIINFTNKYTVDFIIWNKNKYYFIEVFGLMRYPEYVERAKIKIQLCKDNNIPLLELYPKDISMSQFDELSDTIRKFVEN